MKEDADHNSGESDDPADELLGDLQSIRELLDEAQDSDVPMDPDREVPLLDDMVDGAWKLTETTIPDAGPALGGGRRSGRTYLKQDLFDALLGDDWKSSAADVLTGARGAIEAHRNDWSPEDTDELNEALKVRIDETLSEWLHETVRERMDELRNLLLAAAEEAIQEKVGELLRRQDDHGDAPLDG